MKLYRNLWVAGSSAAIAALRLRLESPGEESGWRRSRETEVRWAERAVGAGEQPSVFEHVGTLTPGLLWLFWERSRARVTNIVPTKPGALSHAQYNALAEHFKTHVLDPALVNLEATAFLGATERSLQDAASQGVIDALHAFSGGANRHTLHAHPDDDRRWMKFVIQAHVDSVQLTSAHLEEWLISEGWPTEDAQQLSLEYEQARDLLRFYDELRAGQS